MRRDPGGKEGAIERLERGVEVAVLAVSPILTPALEVDGDRTGIDILAQPGARGSDLGCAEAVAISDIEVVLEDLPLSLGQLALHRSDPTDGV